MAEKHLNINFWGIISNRYQAIRRKFYALKFIGIVAVLSLYFSVSHELDAQMPLNIYETEFRRTLIPFEYVNHFIVVNLILNDRLPLKFILDTGAQHTIITKREVSEILHLQYKREFRVMGADMKRELIANLVTGMSIEIENWKRRNLPMLVLDEDYFMFEEMTGMQIHGILGAGFFRRTILDIDYKRKVIRIKNPNEFKKPDSSFREFDINIESNKPYIDLYTTIQTGSEKIKLKYLIDSGAGVSMLLNPKTTDKIVLPENLIPGDVGNGLGGSIEGFVGRTSLLEIGDMKLNNVITNYHQIENDSTLFQINRNGLIGNEILERFHVIIDFVREKLYLRPGKKFNKEFEYDKSGISVISTGINFNEYIIQSVLKGSPADLAGVQKGDKILKINRLPSWLLSLNSVLKKFKKKEGKRISIKIKRGKKKHKYVFYLKKLI